METYFVIKTSNSLALSWVGDCFFDRACHVNTKNALASDLRNVNIRKSPAKQFLEIAFKK